MTDKKIADELASVDLYHNDDLIMGDIRTIKWNRVIYKYFMATHIFDRVYNEDDYCCDAHYCEYIVWWEQDSDIVSACLTLCIETELGGSVSWPEPGSDLLIYLIGAVEGSEFYNG